MLNGEWVISLLVMNEAFVAAGLAAVWHQQKLCNRQTTVPSTGAAPQCVLHEQVRTVLTRLVRLPHTGPGPPPRLRVAHPSNSQPDASSSSTAPEQLRWCSSTRCTAGRQQASSWQCWTEVAAKADHSETRGRDRWRRGSAAGYSAVQPECSGRAAGCGRPAGAKQHADGDQQA